ncbi:uncharacterized protein LOC128767636 [Synchiropus splendidus]|uniref:uncharacterized protein LOC128767636 n=1 Tax=Synchiropus splendidus TaxID=270530 RepID=UPI00237D6506|nr:uncharacterized protein LOC128767636 [Synchiropus splendidus]
MCRDRERTLAAQLSHQEQVNRELQENQAQLICRIHRQQDLVVALQQRLVLLAEESSRDAELLLQVRSELLCLQSSEVKLEGLVEELHEEAHCRAALALSLQAELHEEAQSRLAMTRRVKKKKKKLFTDCCPAGVSIVPRSGPLVSATSLSTVPQFASPG